jgi:quinol monooxygenase YgiN
MIKTLTMFRCFNNKLEEVKTFFSTMPEAARKEPGCQGFQLLQGTNLPNLFFTLESWTNQSDFGQHLRRPYMQKLQENTANWFEERNRIWTVQELAPAKMLASEELPANADAPLSAIGEEVSPSLREIEFDDGSGTTEDPLSIPEPMSDK